MSLTSCSLEDLLLLVGTCLKPSLRGNACVCLMLCQAGKDHFRGNWQIKGMCNPSPAIQLRHSFWEMKCTFHQSPKSNDFNPTKVKSTLTKAQTHSQTSQVNKTLTYTLTSSSSEPDSGGWLAQCNHMICNM